MQGYRTTKHLLLVHHAARHDGKRLRQKKPDSALALLGFLDFAFLEGDVLANDRVVFLELELLRVVLRVLLGHVKEARVRRADQLDVVLRLSHR